MDSVMPAYKQLVEQNDTLVIRIPEAAIQRCSFKKVFWKYAANLQENTHVKMWFE